VKYEVLGVRIRKKDPLPGEPVPTEASGGRVGFKFQVAGLKLNIRSLESIKHEIPIQIPRLQN
jgi:hypothetical protein